jgi:hypothetical protein
VLLDRFQPKFGAVVPWRSRAVVAATSSHGVPGSGELPAGARELTAWSAPAEARGGLGTVDRPQKLAGTRLGGGDDEASSSGERRTPPERRGGSVLRMDSRCYVTFPRAQILTGAAAPYGGAASRAERAVPAGARVGE